MSDPSHIARAILLYTLAGLFLSSLDATAKILVRDYPVWWVVWARYAGHVLVVLPLAWSKAGSGFWRTGQPLLQLGRSTLLLVATIAFFSGLRYLPLAEASAISFLAPMLVVLLAGPLLGEVVPRARWAAVGVGFAGVLLVTRPGSAAFHPAALAMFAMALFNALYQLLTRKLRGDSAYTTLFYSGIVGTVAFTALLPFLDPHPLPGPGPASLFLMLGVLAGLGHWCMITALLQAQASQLTPFGYLQMVWPIGFGWLLFGQFPDRVSMAGMLVILVGGIWLAWQERRRVQPLIEPPTD
ncbi:MAG: DMT family transporter [Betaproteobacteria bacterium]|nr:DMT family transporter [Betaproteobacteria bacterium]MBK9605378.1 DMT family transporter [Betaproteobacteria bacterium]